MKNKLLKVCAPFIDQFYGIESLQCQLKGIYWESFRRHTRLAKKGSLLFQHTDKEKRGGGENDIQSRST